MLRNSICQLFRTKVRTCLFFLLITFCTMLICLGGNLFQQCRVNMKQFKDIFMTIGVVEQTPIAYVRESSYDVETQSYSYGTRKEYGEVFDLSELDMEGVKYISEPERRPFYSAYLPDYKVKDDKGGYANRMIVEASPYEDCIPNGPVKFRIKKVLYSIYLQNIDSFYFCDHNNDNPQMMYADKTYVMSLTDGMPHGFQVIDFSELIFEYVPGISLHAEQTDASGNHLPTEVPNIAIDEVNDAYYENHHDVYWESLAEELRLRLFKVPVTATNDLNLMMSFYNGDVCIADGEAFSAEDMEQGNAVCLVSAVFAHRNNIQIGDTITLPLRVADYSNPPILDWGKTPLTAEGGNFEVFFTDDYTIKGIYRMMPTGGADVGYQLDENEIIIPQNSVKADDSNNIGIYGDHVSPYNTSFRIPNGTIDDFMEKWEAKGIEDVTIHFYDRGYSKLMDGIAQMERMAVLLLVVGIVMTILVLLFFCSTMITGQKQRTAIERSLGAKKKECICSLLAGILLIAVIGCLIGCLGGMFLTKGVASVMEDLQVFDRNFSSGIVNSGAEEVVSMNGDIIVTIVSFVCAFGFTTLVSFLAAWRNLRYEPLQLLSGKYRE